MTEIQTHTYLITENLTYDLAYERGVRGDDYDDDENYKFTLNAAFKKQWLEDLRSGRYQQGRDSLEQTIPGTSQVRRCCLGVAYYSADQVFDDYELEVAEHIMSPNGLRLKSVFDDDTLGPYSTYQDLLAGAEICSLTGIHSASGSLNFAVWVREAGVTVPWEDAVDFKVANSLTELNDFDLTFAQIADIIEAQFPDSTE